MKGVITIGIIFIIIYLAVLLGSNKASFTNYVAPYASKSQKNWWQREGWKRFGYPYYSYWTAKDTSSMSLEGFENLSDRPAEITMDTQSSLLSRDISDESEVLEYPPNTPAAATLYNNQPYHLLGDEMSPPRVNESISCVNSRSCYATSFDRMISKTGNYRQLTNNYKRGYPDSCSAPYQELVLNFYKAEEIPV
jgi:hypothetical protein